jgi:small subunit ribosomal protein S3
MTITIHSAKPGVIIGRSGAGIEELRKKILGKFFRGKRMNIMVNVSEISQPSLSSRVVGLQIAQDIEKRLPFRRSMKMATERVMKAGAKGVKIMIGGRLNGAEIARTEQLLQGSIPLHNLRADIDFARVRANTIFGVIGIKVWIYKGEIFDDSKKANITVAK